LSTRQVSPGTLNFFFPLQYPVSVFSLAFRESLFLRVLIRGPFVFFFRALFHALKDYQKYRLGRFPLSLHSHGGSFTILAYGLYFFLRKVL